MDGVVARLSENARRSMHTELQLREFICIKVDIKQVWCAFYIDANTRPKRQFVIFLQHSAKTPERLSAFGMRSWRRWWIVATTMSGWRGYTISIEAWHLAVSKITCAKWSTISSGPEGSIPAVIPIVRIRIIASSSIPVRTPTRRFEPVPQIGGSDMQVFLF